MCKKLQQGRLIIPTTHHLVTPLQDAQKAKYIPSVRCFWGTLVAISHLKNSARGPRGLEPFLPGGTHAWIYSKGAIQRHQVPYTCHTYCNKVQIHLQALELFEHIMRGRVQDDVVDFPGLPRIFSSSPILELDQKQILTSVACPDRASAPFPDDVAVSTLECILGNQA